MANRRMFAKTIIDSDAFLDMPLSTQALYFHLSMRADDDGFINNPKKIMRMIGCNDDEMKILIARNYILIFESGVIVIKHWKMHNYIQKDRYHKTVYQEEFKQLEAEENGTYNKNLISMDTKCIQDVSEVDTQVRLGKVSIDNNTYVQEKDLERPAKKDIKNEKYYPLSEKLKTNIQKISPNAIIKDAQLKTWSNDFRLMVEQDNRTYEFIDTLLEKVFKDEFWSKHIRSAGKLRIRLNEGKLDNVGPKPKFEQTNIFNNQQSYMPEYMQKAMKK